MEVINKLSNIELVLLIINLILIISFIISITTLTSKNKKLRKIINKLNHEEKINIIKTSDIDFNKIKLEKSNIKEVLQKETVDNTPDLNNTFYSKNILNEMGTKNQTSPLSLGKGSDVIPLGETQKLSPIDIEKIETYNNKELNKELKKENITPLDDLMVREAIGTDNEDSPIEFTSFESSQEEDAIISYDELIKNTHLAETREKRYNVDVEDDNEFLKELKTFRNNM